MLLYMDETTFIFGNTCDVVAYRSSGLSTTPTYLRVNLDTGDVTDKDGCIDDEIIAHIAWCVASRYDGELMAVLIEWYSMMIGRCPYTGGVDIQTGKTECYAWFRYCDEAIYTDYSCDDVGFITKDELNALIGCPRAIE